jgi:hypothetical protein
VETYGLVLTPEEFDEVNRRSELGTAASVLADYLHTDAPRGLLSAMWQDQSAGGDLFIALTRDAPGVQAELRRLYQFPDNLHFVVHSVSAAELSDTYDAIVAHMTQGALPQVINIKVDEPAGRVDIVVEDATREVSDSLHALFPGRHVRVVAGEPITGQAELRTDPFSPLRGGLAIHISGHPNVAECTSGFILNRSDGTQWMTTAGHCSNAGVLWNQGNFRTINPLDQRGPAGQSDEAAIHIPGPLASNWIYVNDTTVRAMTRAQLSHEDFVGMLTCASFGRSDAIDCGYITDRFRIFTDGNGTRTNLRGVSDTASQRGDSGSPWFNGNVAYGSHFGTIENERAYGHISALLREMTNRGTGTFTLRT